MVGVRCYFIDKVYRGQDFYRRYCKQCSNEVLVSVTPSTLTCPFLVHYQSYTPKKSKPWDRDRIGKQAIIPRGGS
ncbi:unnamed protein product [marine sediment metagenome]|uniref:Uncharacterized protein n=1 Tax=marine sediment metagenome TaxID=412755 RepID=X1RRU8_9ZZZZ